MWFLQRVDEKWNKVRRRTAAKSGNTKRTDGEGDRRTKGNNNDGRCEHMRKQMERPTVQKSQSGFRTEEWIRREWTEEYISGKHISSRKYQTKWKNFRECPGPHISLKKIEERTIASKLEYGATDHLPIVAEVTREEKKVKKARVITKRSMKDFTKEKWNRSLAVRRWERIGLTEDVNEMAEILDEQITEALDECAPLKEFKIRANHKFGLTDKTKKLIKKRDRMRKKVGRLMTYKIKEIRRSTRKKEMQL